MNRPIKFRAWDKFEKRMWPIHSIEWSNQEWCSRPPESDPSFSWVNVEGDDEIINCPPGAVELMQFTGLKDKNGKRIYEDDLVSWIISGQYQDFKIIVQVTFDPLKGVSPFSDSAFKIVAEECEIIGNIYENPELGIGSMVKIRDENPELLNDTP